MMASSGVVAVGTGLCALLLLLLQAQPGQCLTVRSTRFHRLAADFEREGRARRSAAWTCAPDATDCVDLRTQLSCISGVRHQGTCGSCWAHAASSSLADYVCRATERKVDLSPQYLMEVCTECMECNGCTIVGTATCVADHGVAHESCIPYTQADTELSAKCQDGSDIMVARPGLATESEFVFDLNDDPGLQGLKADLSEGWSAMATFLVSDSIFAFFKATPLGVYTEAEHLKGSPVGSHMVEVVGYGSEDGVDFLLLKNSWGKDFGDGGYFRMEESLFSLFSQFSRSVLDAGRDRRRRRQDDHQSTRAATQKSGTQYSRETTKPKRNPEDASQVSPPMQAASDGKAASKEAVQHPYPGNKAGPPGQTESEHPTAQAESNATSGESKKFSNMYPKNNAETYSTNKPKTTQAEDSSGKSKTYSTNKPKTTQAEDSSGKSKTGPTEKFSTIDMRADEVSPTPSVEGRPRTQAAGEITADYPIDKEDAVEAAAAMLSQLKHARFDTIGTDGCGNAADLKIVSVQNIAVQVAAGSIYRIDMLTQVGDNEECQYQAHVAMLLDLSGYWRALPGDFFKKVSTSTAAAGEVASQEQGTSSDAVTSSEGGDGQTTMLLLIAILSVSVFGVLLLLGLVLLVKGQQMSRRRPDFGHSDSYALMTKVDGTC